MITSFHALRLGVGSNGRQLYIGIVALAHRAWWSAQSYRTNL